MKKELPEIVCPVCGQHYLMSEIFLPSSFFGKQYDIKKNTDGTIEYYLGNDPDLIEEYICDGCMTKLKIKANVSFNVEAVKEEDFDADFVSTVNKQEKVKLAETDIFN